MSVQAILLPLFVEVILTFLLLFWLAPMRTRDFGSGAVRPQDVALREPNWPKRTMQFAYSLFQSVRIAGSVLCSDDPRIRHASGRRRLCGAGLDLRDLPHPACLVHVTSNIVRLRGALFAISAVVLAIMWVIYIVKS